VHGRREVGDVELDPGRAIGKDDGVHRDHPPETDGGAHRLLPCGLQLARAPVVHEVLTDASGGEGREANGRGRERAEREPGPASGPGT